MHVKSTTIINAFLKVGSMLRKPREFFKSASQNNRWPKAKGNRTLRERDGGPGQRVSSLPGRSPAARRGPGAEGAPRRLGAERGSPGAPRPLGPPRLRGAVPAQRTPERRARGAPARPGAPRSGREPDVGPRMALPPFSNSPQLRGL